MDNLCELFGKTRQAYYKRDKYNYKEVTKEDILLQAIDKERELMPKLGGRKLLLRLEKYFPKDILPGRDTFFDFLRNNGLLVGRRRRRIRTTYSNHWRRKYPNLIKDKTATSINQIWVSDITYIETSSGFVFLNLITDAYSRAIVGWDVGETLRTVHTLKALSMALKRLPKSTEGLIHHSDRGSQYCSSQYVKKLTNRSISISMTESGDPRENAIAERVNGILKSEWLNQMKFKTIDDVNTELKRVINIYNNIRPHSSLDMMTPAEASKKTGEINKCWNTYYKKRLEPSS